MNEKEIFQLIFEVSQKRNTTAYIVGGFVRDQLFKKEHKKDFDFVVLGGGVDFAKSFAEHVNFVRGIAFDTSTEVGTLIEFPEFHTARFVFTQTENDGSKIKLCEVEFAGARKESYRSDSRKPVVEPATLEEDLSRRDFTVNAMAREVLEGGELGGIIDPFDGLSDYHNKILRTPLDPDETFADDPLRMLRAARFAAQLEFTLEEQTYKALEKNASRLNIISAERISEELLKLLKTDQPSIGLWILANAKLFDQFFSEISALAGVEEVQGYSHKDNLSHTFAVVDNIAEQSENVWLRLAGLVHDIAKPQTKKFVPGRGWTFDMHDHLGKKMAREIFRRLRIGKKESEYVAKLVRWHLQPIALMDEGITDSAVRRLIVNAGDELSDLLILCRSDTTIGNQKKKVHRLKNHDQLEKRIAEVIETDKLRAFQSPVHGEEIMQLCGLVPGPTIGKIKEAIEEAILEGIIPNEYEAAKEYFEKIKDEYVALAKEWEKVKNVPS